MIVICLHIFTFNPAEKMNKYPIYSRVVQKVLSLTQKEKP